MSMIEVHVNFEPCFMPTPSNPIPHTPIANLAKKKIMLVTI